MKTLLLILAIPLCVAAQAPASSPLPATNEPTTGTITGKVVNEAGQPMPGASAFVRAVNASTSRTTITDSDGNFQVSGLEPALYTIGASAPAYTTIPSDPNTPPVYYRIGDTARLELVRGGVITGMVTNALGEPVIAVRVRAMLIRDAKGQVVRDNFGGSEQSTDDRGIYRMFGLRPGTYLVSAGGFGGVQTFQFNPYDSDVPTYAPSSTRDNAAARDSGVRARCLGRSSILSGALRLDASRPQPRSGVMTANPGHIAAPEPRSARRPISSAFCDGKTLRDLSLWAAERQCPRDSSRRTLRSFPRLHLLRRQYE